LSEQTELEKLQAMRAELEAESRSLIEEQQKLEKNVQTLEEQVVIEKLKKEKAVIEDLKNRNKAAKDAIANLAAKKQELEKKLNPEPQAPPPAPEEAKPPEPQEPEEAPQPVEAAPEEDDGGVTVTAIEGEALVENQEIADESSKQEKKKRRFF
jgi:DNA repair exonuclease SbcCD ATPase subunit